MSNDPLAWENDWEEFVKLLRSQFGPIDPTANAADSIDNLCMKDNQRILKYNIEFTRLATQTGWCYISFSLSSFTDYPNIPILLPTLLHFLLIILPHVTLSAFILISGFKCFF